MLIGGGRQETLDLGFMEFGTHHQGVPVLFLRELVLPDEFHPISPRFTMLYNRLDVDHENNEYVLTKLISKYFSLWGCKDCMVFDSEHKSIIIGPPLKT
ncbi:unnamed protein product [Schistosoma margrebowiei]|uniref:Uncharacterized protein n=1 Tax=Schistosoma margrebowiei TaxID=48269 RepID=A0A183LB81_9TREM|nr:unnamed protein product [Schistosoma margrebowiei]